MKDKDDHATAGDPLLKLLADIRAAAGDPEGRLMQDELVAHIKELRKDQERLDWLLKAPFAIRSAVATRGVLDTWMEK